MKTEELILLQRRLQIAYNMIREKDSVAILLKFIINKLDKWTGKDSGHEKVELEQIIANVLRLWRQ